MPMPALLKVLFLRMFRRAECRIAITVTLLCCLIAFGETCFKFYGADVGELPSAAYAWAWNMDAMQVNASRVYLFFVMPVAQRWSLRMPPDRTCGLVLPVCWLREHL